MFSKNKISIITHLVNHISEMFLSRHNRANTVEVIIMLFQHFDAHHNQNERPLQKVMRVVT